MTFEELKQEAERQGYILVKKPKPMPKLMPCLCGRKKLDIWQRWNETHEEYKVSCPVCGRGEDNEFTDSRRKARELWNSYVGGEE